MLGRRFGWLWSAYAVSALGTWLAFNAFPLIAIRVLHAGPAAVAALAAAGPAVGAVVAVPLGPWMEFRRKRPVMVAMDLLRFAATMSVPAAYALGRLTFAQLLVVSVIVAAAEIAFRAASGAYLKALVPPADLLVANGRLESTAWTVTAIAPLLAVLMLGRLGFAPWEYGLAFGAPCVGGFIGSRLARRVVARSGRHRVMIATGTLQACWPIGLAFIRPGVAGLVLVIVVELGLITSMSVFNPVIATYRLEQSGTRVARVLSAWTITTRASTAAMVALWGLLAAATSPRTAIAIAGLLMLATPLLLPRRVRVDSACCAAG